VHVKAYIDRLRQVKIRAVGLGDLLPVNGTPDVSRIAGGVYRDRILSASV
jgi:hypothetical protein